MRKTTLPLITAVGIVVSACAPRVDVAKEEAAIRDLSAKWLAMDRARDHAGIAALFAPDARVAWENRPSAVGPAAIEALVQQNFAFAPDTSFGFSPERVDVAASGDLAVEHGRWRDPADSGRYVTVYRKMDGAWKVVTDVSLSTAEAGAAPDWARKALADWYQAYNGRNAQALADLYTADAVAGDAKGRAAIQAMFRAEWAASPRECSGNFDDFVVVGPLALGRGRDSCTGKAADGTTTTYRSHWVSVYERQPDGTWLCSRDRGEPVEGT